MGWLSDGDGGDGSGGGGSSGGGDGGGDKLEAAVDSLAGWRGRCGFCCVL